MPGTNYNSGQRSFRLYILVKCEGEKKMRIWAQEMGKQNSKYADREIVVSGQREIYFSFPVSPSELFIGAVNCNDKNDVEFKVELREEPLVQYNVFLDSQSVDFVDFIIPFCQICGYQEATPKGRIKKSSTGEFKLKFMDVIRDATTGKYMNTPARIGHKSGMIEIAKAKFDNYTIPMRLIICLHEFSHKYRNPKIGLEIENEVGADINALYIYLGLGFSPIDAICVFANVFLKAQTQGNMDRMRKIMDYVQRFESEEYATKLLF